MKSDELDISDLLADDSFINYCRRSSATDVAYWEAYLEKHPDRRPIIDEARQKFVTLFNALAQADMEEQANLLMKKLSLLDGKPGFQLNSEKDGFNTWRRVPRLLKLSAASIILVVVTIVAFNNYNSAKTKAVKTFVSVCGERKNIQLPDGSIVILNAASKIEIDNSFGISSRNVYLEGEAFFDVKHDAEIPFIVHTPVMDVKALGTAFDVKAYRSDKVTETSLIRGLVEVTLKESKNRRMLLHPNQKIRWVHPLATDEQAGSSAMQTSTQLNLPNALTRELKVNNSGSIKEIAWTENKLVFEDEPLEEVSRLLGRWYGVNIQFKDDAIRSYRFTGMFEKEDLNTVLGFLKESRHFNYAIEPGDPETINLSK